MYYAMLFGKLPYFSTSEEEIIDLIINAPLKFPSDVTVTSEAKEIIKSMLQKDPAKRIQLLDIMNTEYYMMDDDELEDKIKKVEAEREEKKMKEEEKAEKQWESDILLSI
jgi:serine/threonine protein kinase